MTGAEGAMAAQHAEQERKRRREEEEIMAGYTPQDLQDHWQFKIVKGSFKTRAQVEAVIQEQAAFGWSFVEIFDPQRIRFKRPASAVQQDEFLDGNPYDTTSRASGPGCVTTAALIMGAGLGFGWWWLA
jgi:hypothetical protein